MMNLFILLASWRYKVCALWVMVALVAVLPSSAQTCNQRVVWPGISDSCLFMSTGLDEEAFALALQPDRKIVVAGAFSRYNGLTYNRIVRIDAEGAVDSTFVGGSVFSSNGGQIYGMAQQPDGKLVLVGNFMMPSPRGTGIGLRRLLADGTADQGFFPDGFDYTLYCVALQGNGKVLVGGSFTRNDAGMRLGGIARLKPNGEVDSTFNTGRGFDEKVSVIIVQPDGKLLVGGSFTNFNGTPRRYIARLHENGTLDTSFRVNPGPDAPITAIALQADGKVLVGGRFIYYDRFFRQYLARLLPDGALDRSFRDPNLNGFVKSIALQPDGKVLAGGSFSSPAACIARFDTTGNLDRSFISGGGFRSNGGGYVSLNSLLLQTDGRMLAAGVFNTYNGSARGSLARLYTSNALMVSAVGISKGNLIIPFPNPAHKELQFRGLDRTATVHLYDAVGRLVFVSKALPNQATALPTLPPGIYRWRCLGQSGNLLVQ